MRELAFLKRQRPAVVWVGEILHGLVDTALQAAAPLDSAAQEALRAQGVARLPAGLAAAEAASMRGRLERCLLHFFTMPKVVAMAATPRHARLAQESQGTLQQAGVTVVVKPDLAYRDDAGLVHIVDWKTGAAHAGDAEQMALYGLYASQTWGGRGLPRAHLVYLQEGRVQSFEVDAAQQQAARARIATSAAKMRAIAAAPPLTFAPLPAAAAFAAAFDGQQDAHLPPTPDRATCRRCAFDRLCRRG